MLGTSQLLQYIAFKWVVKEYWENNFYMNLQSEPIIGDFFTALWADYQLVN